MTTAFPDAPQRAEGSTARLRPPARPAARRYVPHLLNLLRQVMAYQGPTAEDPAVLGAVSASVLVPHGSDARPFPHASARYVADHVPDARVREVPGAGHAAPLTHPEALAKALTEFFAPAQQPA